MTTITYRAQTDQGKLHGDNLVELMIQVQEGRYTSARIYENISIKNRVPEERFLVRYDGHGFLNHTARFWMRYDSEALTRMDRKEGEAA